MCRDCSCGQPAPEPLPQPTRQLPLHTALRQRFEAAGVTLVNLLSSPGSGKTALLEALAGRLVEAGIPCFDSCLSCSTHAAGQMPLRISLLDAGVRVLAEQVRDCGEGGVW